MEKCKRETLPREDQVISDVFVEWNEEAKCLTLSVEMSDDGSTRLLANYPLGETPKFEREDCSPEEGEESYDEWYDLALQYAHESGYLLEGEYDDEMQRAYKRFLKEWRSSFDRTGQEPPCFDEWYDNERLEILEEQEEGDREPNGLQCGYDPERKCVEFYMDFTNGDQLKFGEAPCEEPPAFFATEGHSFPEINDSYSLWVQEAEAEAERQGYRFAD